MFKYLLFDHDEVMDRMEECKPEFHESHIIIETHVDDSMEGLQIRAGMVGHLSFPDRVFILQELIHQLEFNEPELHDVMQMIGDLNKRQAEEIPLPSSTPLN